MAHFRGTIEGQRGPASRLGSPKSGLVATVNGWDAGLRIYAEQVNGEDTFTVILTGGSNGSSADHVLGSWTRKDLDHYLAARKAS